MGAVIPGKQSRRIKAVGYYPASLYRKHEGALRSEYRGERAALLYVKAMNVWQVDR